MKTALQTLILALALALVATVSTTSPVLALQYETFLEIENEEDIWDLYNQGVLDEDSREALLELMSRGVDLNSASRGDLYQLPNLTYEDVDAILAYRDEAGFIADPAQLVSGNVLSEEKLLGIAPFLLVGERQGAISVNGFVRYQTRWIAGDSRGVPPMALQARVFTLKHLRLGLASVLTQTRIGAPVVDPNRENALVAEGSGTRVDVPKVYAMWDTDRFQVIAGSYQIGFGQKLTFDDTTQYEPNGIYPDDRLYRDNISTKKCRESAGELAVSPCADDEDTYVTPDFTWRETLFGMAAGLRNVELGPGTIQAYGFSSYQRKQIYQYQLINSDMCADPRIDSDACESPGVYVRRDDPLEPTSRFKFTTLPDMYAEATAGGNVTYNVNRRTSLGITGYGSDVHFLTEGIHLDFQDWARTPFGGPFGAVGVNGSYGKNWADVFVEVTRSFDSMTDGGGGLGSILRAVGTFKGQEIEVSGRYYDKKFANPYARPISAADQFEGLRARNEAGGRFRYSGLFSKRLSLRANADLWTDPDTHDLQSFLYLRSDIIVSDRYRWGLWADYRNNTLEGEDCRTYFGPDFEISDENGNPTQCAINRASVTGRFRVVPRRGYWLDLQYRHNFYDGGRQDLSATAIGSAKLASELNVRGRIRWNWDDIDDNASLENSVWAYLELNYRLRARDTLRLRYDYIKYIDDRMSTLERSPNPEHWLWFYYEAKL